MEGRVRSSKRDPSMVGSISANFHEGYRSEYLAQYVFASFGTAVAVPTPEDSGVDLHCTLTERIGQRAWSTAYYAVQVKSPFEPWKFNSEESVRWLVTHPLPLFLCIVEKATARLRVYHTSPRFYLWSLPPLPQRVELVPTIDTQGKCTQWKEGEIFSLSAPILDFSIQDMLQDGFHESAKQVLRLWIDIDQKNIRRVKTGIHSFTMPADYQTGSTEISGWAKQGVTRADNQNMREALEQLKELLAWMTSQFYINGKFSEAVRGALLLRHLFKDDHSIHDFHLHQKINRLLD